MPPRERFLPQSLKADGRDCNRIRSDRIAKHGTRLRLNDSETVPYALQSDHDWGAWRVALRASAHCRRGFLAGPEIGLYLAIEKASLPRLRSARHNAGCHRCVALFDYP